MSKGKQATGSTNYQPPASNKNPETTVCERQVSVQKKRRLDCTFTKVFFWSTCLRNFLKINVDKSAQKFTVFNKHLLFITFYR